MRAMRSLSPFLLLAALLGGAYVWHADACTRPVEYSIGSIDPRFGLSSAELQATLAEAEGAWEAAAGRELFQYGEHAPLPVNLIFDERQEQTLAGKKLESELAETKAAQEALGESYSTALSQYQAKRKAYEAGEAAFEKDLTAYNQEVTKWNKAGGAPSDEYAKLKKKSQDLETRSRELESLRVQVNALAARVNSFSDKESQVVESYNSQVDAYADRYGEPREFDQGEYTGKSINVYEFADREELRLVLAHELGHALGIGHVDNPQSVMYYLMQAQSFDPLQLTDEDRSALGEICSPQNLLSSDSLKRSLVSAWEKARAAFPFGS